MKQIDSIAPYVLACRVEIAKEQSVRHASRLALWRCTTASDYAELQMMRHAPSTPQSRWYTTTQQDFTAWLAAGGFAQEDVPPSQCGESPGDAEASAAPTLHETV